MARQEPFYFCVPLLARSAAGDWERIDELLKGTLRSVLGQSDPDFYLLLMAHDEPPCWPGMTGGDSRFELLRADWPPATPTAANDDGGAKKFMLQREVERRGGGMLMFLDADDLVDRRTVATARAQIGPGCAGGIVAEGVLIDFDTARCVQVPDPRLFEGRFHELCGSTTIGRIGPGLADPFALLGSHHRWHRSAPANGVTIVDLPLCGGYLVNTKENHSEEHGPHAAWRAELASAVGRLGRPLPAELASSLGRDGASPQNARLRQAGVRNTGG